MASDARAPRAMALHRRVNLGIEAAIRSRPGRALPEEDVWPFRCECGRLDCHAELRMTPADFEAIRSSGRYAVLPEHVDGRARIVQRTRGYVEVAAPAEGPQAAA